VKSLFALSCIILLATLSTIRATEPKVVRENIEWLDVWVPNSNARDLPRVLLIGDSITRGYYREVEDKLKGKAYVARLATSKSVGDPGLLAEISMVLGQAHFDVIHFNNGLHGWGYSEEDYDTHFPQLLVALRNGAKGAKLIWGSTTPMRESAKLEQLSPKTERIKARNKLAADLITRENIPINDLFSLVANHPEYQAKDGVHFNAQGTSALAEQVAQRIRLVLK
jgi:hypothetical protein